ncbi:carbonic anhydrase [Desulfocicer vacuolatum DSM 3385]|uniref:Carbonic anhydrase n=1 Tax=Desulfocicer vacuolatum DSM 3385 TaxID=1121400 RepID=A0A1W2BP29_9BACT|nr:carbonic anhydrase [Desulfocicer vacuolatum]SMC74432.1 carbonic anhydrase [Desulfocicer vacuolatum DSM 3385]
MDEKKNKIILWAYLGVMFVFILVVTFVGDDAPHSPAATDTHNEVAMETHAASKGTVEAAAEEKHHAKAGVQANETEVLPAQEQEDVAKDASHAATTGDTAAIETQEAHAVADTAHEGKDPFEGKPSPDEAISLLKKGNQRFVHGESAHPHMNLARLLQAGSENQGDHAYATVITCSDSRVPVEAIFDAGIMDIFVIRVAGNVCDVDERGSIEYGLAHVNTPVLVVLGHTQCGAVTAVTQAVLGHGHALERNIPALVDNIIPAVKKAMADHPEIQGEDIIPMAIEENIWTGIEELFMESPATRNLVAAGKVTVVGAVYDVGEGTIKWLPQEKSMEILKKVEENPDKAVIE